jgi:iron complex outermembrane receptor protein
MRSVSHLTQACLLALLAVRSAAAQPTVAQDLKRLSIEELTQLDITTLSRHGEPLSHAPAAVTVLRGEDIRRSGIRWRWWR